MSCVTFRLQTDRLVIQPANSNDLSDYVQIYGDKRVRQWMMDGSLIDAEKVKERVEIWEDHFRQGNPFSAYTVRRKEDGTFAGSIHLTPSDTPGTAQLASMFVADQHKKGYGSEAAASFMYQHVPSLLLQRNLIQKTPLQKIEATARIDNEGSKQILKMLGFSILYEKEKWGRMRIHYLLDLSSADYQLRCVVFSVIKSGKAVSLISEYATGSPQEQLRSRL